MYKRLSLTGILVVALSHSAFAVPSNTSPSFPVDEYMLPDYTYQNQANYTNMGIYGGTVQAQAEYDPILYTVSAGKYLAAGGESVTNCTSGNFCPGLQNPVTYDANNPQGLEPCPNGFGNSAIGASANTDCFRTCDINNVGTSITAISHAATLTGNDYYGNGVDTCEPASCENGWHVRAHLNIATTIGNTAGTSAAYIDGSNNFTEDDANNGMAFYGLTNNDTNAFAVNFGNLGVIRGHAACSNTPGTAVIDGANSSFSTEQSITDETGEPGAQFCWCHIDGYTRNDGTPESVSSVWVYRSDIDQETYCSNLCAGSCSGYLQEAWPAVLVFRSTILDSISQIAASCDANTITINWTGASASAISDNNAGSVTYGGDIRTPKSATPIPGKTFKGWKFIKP